jgi:methanesulfonate monooxygenase large subunit
MARTAADWDKKPALAPTHYVDPRIYSDPTVFAEEQEKIFAKVWVIACHESELPNPNDYRTFAHPAGKNLLVARGEDGKVRTFYNVCPHRGNTIVYNPAGNGKHITCIFHAWAFNTKGDCIDITREKQGYGDRLNKKDYGLREVRTAVGYGGMVWVNLDDAADPLEEYVGHALDGMLKCLESEPLDIFHYHKAVVNTNFKFWHDTNSEFYHDYMHYHNRQTSMLLPTYWEREYVPFPNGHAQVGDQVVNYEAYEGFHSRELSFPGLPRNGWKMVDLFPNCTYNIRGSSLRLDTMTPQSPTRTVIEFRGLGLRRDTPAERSQRIRDYNSIWGPFGRNLHEDLLGVMGQGRAIGRGQTWILHGREEQHKIHDEVGMRHYYTEWTRRMGRSATESSRMATVRG